MEKWKCRLSILFVFAMMAVFLSSCAGKVSDKQIEKALRDNPDIVFDVIKDHPKKFFDVLQQARDQAIKAAQEEAKKQEEKELEEAFKNPKKPEIASDRAIFGEKSAPITIVEYSDFQCPYCSRAAKTMDKVLSDYQGKVRLLYKHLPFKPMAKPAAQYFEAIAMESTEKAKKFHDYIYENQRKLSGGEDFLKEAVKAVGADLKVVLKNKESDKVAARLDADKSEAQKFGFSGTPGFLVNGVPVKGAHPYDHFKMVIDRHLNEK